jgi:predicted transposase YdaD
MRPDAPNPFDRSLKVLIRRALPTLLRLAGVEVDPAQVRPDDTAITLPEHHADHVFRIGDEDDPTRWALHLEYQLQPDPRVLPDWFYKNAALNKLLPIPVVLMAVYLTRGDRATFPDGYTIQGGSLRNQYLFEVIRLWEHAERIRSGELPELAPLLVLCEDRPTEATLRQERQLILSLDVARPVRADLLAVAVTVGTRDFARELLEAIFQEEMVMLKEASFITDWIEEGEARGEARGKAEGEALGQLQEARRFLLRQLAVRFGELPAPVIARVEQADTAECEEWGVRLLQAATLEEMGLLKNGTGAS